ncbi:hypothetical protein [Pedobacter sp. ASV28]|uniref:MutS-related protein n=1 Tax=Pedobacter sp. ASV28 TaxID=2795123 RepID=UPI0018EBF638|nr:hypothetical protein [Pedobacter sp. ASV28]
MLYLIVALAAGIIAICYLQYQNKQKKLKRITYIIDKWGKPTIEDRNFKLISQYHECIHQHTGEMLTDEIAQDIDLEKLFAYIDRTNSKPGQQYLYQHLRKGQKNLELLHELDGLTEQFQSDDDLRIKCEAELIKLSHRNAYYIHELFTSVYHALYQSWLAIYIKAAGILWLLSLVFTITERNQYLFLITLGLTFFNFYIHYTNKKKIARYVHSLPQLYLLMGVAQKCSLLIKNADTIAKSLKELKPLRKTLSFINFQDDATKNDSTDISSGIFELIKTLLLIEPLMFLVSINNINQQKANIKLLFDYITKIDTAISIQSLRVGLPYYSKPNFTANTDKLQLVDLYHPLIENCIPNSIIASLSQGNLITGSNMSGKTTFIRAIVINAILSQTLFTSCTKNSMAPFMSIFTSIRINDNIEEHKSYFQAEALSILNILEKSAQQTNSLVIIDEIFRGTNTIERISAAKAILSYLTCHKNFVFVSTHDLELAELLGPEYLTYSFEERAADTRLIFDYKIKAGLLKNKNGIAILTALGYPETIIENANTISNVLRKKYNLNDNPSSSLP